MAVVPDRDARVAGQSQGGGLCVELIVHKGDIVWYDSAVIRKAEQEGRSC